MISTTRPSLSYRIRPLDLPAHLFEVTCTVPDPDPAGQRLRLPTWIPGSYLVREFARHVVSLEAACEGRRVAVEKTAKDTWRCAPCQSALEVRCEVYAWDLSVRGAHLDDTHGYFNGACVFLAPEGREDRPCEVEILPPSSEAARPWRVATSLRPLRTTPHGFGTYTAADHDELIDHPVEMGRFDLIAFKAGGAVHEVALTGRHRADQERLARDLERLCQWHIDLFGGARNSTAPFDRYVFLVTAVGKGYGGLEHRTSTSLLCSREDLPRRGLGKPDEKYRTFLGLASHEYFHAWNVKRIKPAAFVPYDLAREAYTRQLWAFEGITSYYDDLALVRAGLIETEDYLELLGRSLTALLRTPGRLRQSLAEASLDAWIKYYRQDENTPNVTVSYYLKGSLVALLLDLELRRRASCSLDEVMRALWQAHGSRGIGVPEDGVQAIAQRVSGIELGGFFERFVSGTDELPLAEALAAFGIALRLRAPTGPADKGGKPSKGGEPAPPALGARLAPGAEATLAHVLPGGAAHRAGLSAGDVVIAVDGTRVDAAALEEAIARRRPGETLEVHAFRRDELMHFSLTLAEPPVDTAWLELDPAADEAAIARREAWLGQAS